MYFVSNTKCYLIKYNAPTLWCTYLRLSRVRDLLRRRATRKASPAPAPRELKDKSRSRRRNASRPRKHTGSKMRLSMFSSNTRLKNTRWARWSIWSNKSRNWTASGLTCKYCVLRICWAWTRAPWLAFGLFLAVVESACNEAQRDNVLESRNFIATCSPVSKEGLYWQSWTRSSEHIQLFASCAPQFQENGIWKKRLSSRRCYMPYVTVYMYRCRRGLYVTACR